MRLGLFHLQHRVVETLDQYCELYWKCLVELKKCSYEYNSDDYNRLIDALTAGRFNKDGRSVTSAEIEEIRHSKRWKERYEVYLRKNIFGGATIQHNLSKWIDDWKNRTDWKGRPVFTARTEKVARDQLCKVQHVSDVPGLEMYREVPPGPRTTHGLSKWLSDRPEAALEKYHEYLAHLANTGSNPDLADPLTLGGTAEFNVKQRWKSWLNKKKLEQQDPGIPGHFEEEPRFWDHSLLNHLNVTAECGGLSRVFDDVFEIGEDNGEVFLSDYFLQQQERNRKYGQDRVTSMCLCDECLRYVPSERSTESEEQNLVENQLNSTQPRPRPNMTTTQPRPTTIAPPIINPEPNSTQLVPTAPQRIVDMRCVYVWSYSHSICYNGYPFYCNEKELCLRKILAGERVLGRHKHDLACPRRLKLKKK